MVLRTILGLCLLLACAAQFVASVGPPADEQVFLVVGGNSVRKEAASLVPGMATRSPLKVHRAPDGLFRVDVEIDGQIIDMVVDTGATRTIISSAAMSRLPTAKPNQVSHGTVYTLTGQAAYRLHRVEKIGLGSKTLHNSQIAIIDSNRKIALLGQDLLARVGPVTIDGDWLHLP